MITAELCDTCGDDATEMLDGVPYCSECYREELQVLMAPAPHGHVGNHHPETPLSELLYNGTNDTRTEQRELEAVQ
jgi:hypothetical protein